MSALADANILVVDDNPVNLKLLVEMLKQSGYKVRAATDGKTALISLEKYLPDLILLDINMPEMNGYEVAQQLQSNPTTQEIPIIFISALNDTESIVSAFKQGGVDYVSKPFHFAEVNARIRTHLTLHFQRQQIAQFHERDKQQLEKITRSEERYRDLFDHASDIIQSIDNQGRFLYANQAWHDLLGYTSEEILQMTFADIIHEDHLEHCLKVFEDIRHHPNTNQIVETIFVTKTGNEIFVQGNVNSRHDPEIGFHTRGIFRDITEQRIAEKHALQFALERERHQMLSDFIRDSSHELRTPLSVILQQLYFINRLATDERQLQKVKIAEQKIKDINHMIDQLHDFVALNAKYTVDTSHIDVSQWIENCIQHSVDLAHHTNVTVKAHIADDLPAIEGNLPLLQQALSELITNAIRFAPPDTIVEVAAKSIADNILQISVTDQGVGITPEYHHKVFTPLFKINQARTADGSGIGLGLSVVKRIIDLHYGDVIVISRNNQDALTQFVIHLPLNAEQFSLI